MSTLPDLTPTARELARLVAAVDDDQLTGPTPCPDYRVADLLDHIHGLTIAFTHAATKEPLSGAPGPSGDGARLPDSFRTNIPAELDALAAAWLDPAALEGTTMAGPIEMPGPEAGLVALDEIVVHAWDLAAATGQVYAADPAAVDACLGFVAAFEVPEGTDDESGGESGGGLFGPPVAVADNASALERLRGLTGRDPAWRG